jgi:hypothetical protein
LPLLLAKEAGRGRERLFNMFERNTAQPLQAEIGFSRQGMDPYLKRKGSIVGLN